MTAKTVLPEPPLEYISLDIQGPLPSKWEGNQLLLAMTDRYNKLTVIIPTTGTKVSTVPRIFPENRVVKYGIPSSIITENGPQFVSRFFVAVCSTLRVNINTTIERHPQTLGQEEHFNSALIL